ncbi:hypothetical protein CBR_g45874 [Chara braunii]|uniref:RNA-directed DNA polymerase n=1 Tax=Chara braunii TaxID=69332 RepID=A0A388LZG3_CHABU|nr:hypothetical protein CBR_g45874 [Chara braunii]|eukprot:GBG87720.1 hypothetical protein CBR_g45874 [Chara braunii]
MSQGGGASGAPKKGLTLDDLIAAIVRHERNPSNIPKVDTFHFCGERVSEWLERAEQALVGRSDVVKFQRILQYVLHSYHQEVKKVIDAAQGSWMRFKEGMQRKYRLGDGLLTTADLEAMNKEDFTTIGAFVQKFKKRAWKVHGISQEAQCIIFLGLLTTSETIELTRHGGGSTKLTWATIDRGVEVGCLDQVEQRQVCLQRQKRKERDATASGTPGVTRIVTDVLAQLGYATEPVVQRRVVTVVQVKGKEPVIEEVVQEELWEEEEPVPQRLTKAQRKVRNLTQGGQGSGKAKTPQALTATPLNVAAPSSSTGPSQGGAPSYGQREDERSGLISSNMDENIYDQFGETIDRRLGGVRAEAQRRAAAGPPPPAMFRLWQKKKEPSVGIEEFRLWHEKEEPPIGVEEVGSDEEVTQGPQGGSEGEESIIIESDKKNEEKRMEPPSVLLGKVEDLLDKMRRYEQKLVGLCEEVRKWKSSIPKVFLYDSGPESAPEQPGVNVVGSCPPSGMMGRPLTPQARLAQAARTRNQASASQEPPRREQEPGKRKEAVKVEDDDDEEEEDERLHQEEDQRAEQRARKKGARGEVGPVIRDGPPKRKKYAVRLEEGFDVEKVIDRLLEGHNDLMTLKEILASAPRLRDELKGRLSRRLVPNVHLGTILPKEAEWAESGTKMDWNCVACGTVDLVVKGSKCAAMVDTGAEMKIIREADAIRFGLDIDRSDCGILHRASCKAVFCRIASNVLIDVGKVKARACFFIMPDVDHGILLGRSFLSRTETVIFNKHDGTLVLLLCDPVCGNYEVITCRNTGPRSIRNRPNPGSFTIEESEGNEGKLIIGEPDFLLPQERMMMVELMKRRHRAYAFSDEEHGRMNVDKIPMIRIHTMPHEPWNMRGTRYPNTDEEKKVVDYLDGKIYTHVADYSSGLYASPWFCFIKPNGTLRWVQDLQRLNAVTVRDAGGLPNADALSESCAGRPIISLIDLYSGYDQFPVYPPDRPVTAMHTPRGLIHMNVAPQGPHITQPYIYDLEVKGTTVKESDEVSPGVRRFVWKHIQDLEKVLGLLEEHNLTASRVKSRHFMREATILGFVCSEKGRRPDVKKTDKITEWPVSFRSIADVRSFLGTCGFWRAFVKNFGAKTEYLRKLVRQDQEWVWAQEQEEVVARMKEEFREGGLVLGASDYDATETRPFIVETDVGPTALRGVLIQADMEGKERPLRFESRTLCTTERNFSLFKRETLAFLHCLRIFRNYIFGMRFILRVDPTALAYSLRNYIPSDPAVTRWLTYIWMFNFELERIPGSKNRADGLSRINWDKQEGEVVENTPPVDGFLDQEEDVRLHINKWSPRVPSCVGYPIWQAPNGYERRAELVLKPFEEEDPWGSKDVQWMMELALASSHSLVEDVRMIEEGSGQVQRHEELMGGMHLVVNTLLQEGLDQSGSLNPAGNVDEVPESQDDEFEEGEIKETFRAEEYDRIYLELGLLLSCEMRLRDASDRAQRMLQRYLVRDGYLFVRREVGNPRRVVCGRNRQIEVVAALHDGIAGGHRGVQATYAKISELYYWDGMMDMVGKFCRSCGIPRDEWARTLPLWTRKAKRALGTQVRDMARDWESCRAHLREVFRRPEPPHPRVERRQRSQRQRDPEPREARPSRGGRKALARREEEPEPEAEERGAYPECGLGQVEFHRFAEGKLRRSSARTQHGPPASEESLRELEAHLDISQWRASPRGEEHGEQAEKEPPMGRVILEPEVARAQRQAEREAFKFKAPTEFATLPVAAAGPVVPLAVEEGLPPSSSEPTQGSAEGSMGVLLEAVHTMQEEVSLFSPEQRIKEPLGREMGIEAEGAIEGGLQRLGTPEYGPEEEQPMAVPGKTLERRPQRLDTPEYVPATGDLRSRLGSWATGSGSGGPVPGTAPQEVASTAAPRSEQQGVVSTSVGSPSSPPPQPRKKKFKRKSDQLCFYCKRDVHLALDCLEFLEDKAAGKISEVGGKMYDRQGRIVEKSADGLRAQLYRQNHEELRR